MSSYCVGSSDEDSMSAASTIPNSPDSTCRVVIVEQPMEKVRFRYLSELQGMPHGPLLGERSTKSNKSFPRVKLEGYDGVESVKIRCWLVDKAPRSLGGVIRPHCHDLVVRKNVSKNEIVHEPHEIAVSRDNNYTAVFENMVVLHCVQKNSESTYYNKELKWKDRLPGVSSSDSNKFDKKKIRDTIKCINKNEVYLYFEAFVETRDSEDILCWMLSNPVKNLKNPMSGDLKIIKVVNSCGPTDGNTEIALFTEKVPPDVKVKFTDDSTHWKEVVLPETTHRYLAITIRSPKYPYIISSSVKVKFCLYRESDGCESNTMEFTYLPSESPVLGKRKRMEISSEEQLNANNPVVGKQMRLYQYASCSRFFEKVDKSSDGDRFLDDRIVLLPEELGLNSDELRLTDDRLNQPSDQATKQSTNLADLTLEKPTDSISDLTEQSSTKLKEKLEKYETKPVSTVRVKQFEMDCGLSDNPTKAPHSDRTKLIPGKELTDHINEFTSKQSTTNLIKESSNDHLEQSSGQSEHTVQKLSSDHSDKTLVSSDTNKTKRVKIRRRILIPVNRFSALSKCLQLNDSDNQVKLKFNPVKSCSDSGESTSDSASQSNVIYPRLKPMTTITYGSKLANFSSNVNNKLSSVDDTNANGSKPLEKSAPNPTKVFRVTKAKFQSYLNLMKQQGYIVKSVT